MYSLIGCPYTCKQSQETYWAGEEKPSEWGQQNTSKCKWGSVGVDEYNIKKKVIKTPGTVAHTCNSSTRALGRLRQHDIPNYMMGACLKTNKKPNRQKQTS